MARRTQIRILVVDDMAVSRHVLVQMLDRFGVRGVTAVPSGAAALEELRRCPADLVISDLNMPDMDGVELLGALRAGRRTRGIGFVLTSGLDASPRFAAARELGVDALLLKPFEGPQLLAAVERVAGRL